MKRAYFCRELDEPEGIAVIATNRSNAMQIAMGFLNCAWIDVRMNINKADVQDLPLGILKNDLEGLKRGIYGYIINSECPHCHRKNTTVYWDGDYYCPKCEEEVLYGENKNTIGETQDHE